MNKQECMEGFRIEKTSHKLILQSTVAKVLCLSTAFDDTFVFSKVINPGADESIVHVDKYGQVLFEHKYLDIINFFGMLNEDQVIVMDVPNEQIDIINLRQKQVRSIKFTYIYDDVSQMSIETFFDTKMFCIIEKGTFNCPNLRLSYFRESDYKKNLSQTIVPCSTYDSSSNWSYEYPVKKLNTKSKIGWFKYNHKQYIQFYVYSLDKNPNGQLSAIRVKNTIGEPYGLNNMSLSIATFWEGDQDSYIIVGNSNKQNEGNNKATNKDGIVNNNYVVNVKDGTVRQTKFYFKDPINSFPWNDQLIEYFTMGDVSVFHTFRHEAEKTLRTPVYYIHNVSEQIVAEQSWQATCYINFFAPGFAKDTVIEGFYENGDVKEIMVTTKRVKNKMIDPRIISMFFMLHLNEDFDDDLLSDAIDLLHGEE